MKPVTEHDVTTSPIPYAQEPRAIDSASSLLFTTPTFNNSYTSAFTADTFAEIPHSTRLFTPTHIPLFPPTSLQPPSLLSLTKPYPRTQDSYMSEPFSLSSNVSNHNAFGYTSVLSELIPSHTSGCSPTTPQVAIHRRDDGDFNLDCTMYEAHSVDEDVERTSLMESAAWAGDEGLMDVPLGNLQFEGECGMDYGGGGGIDWEFWTNAGVPPPEVVVEDMIVGDFEKEETWIVTVDGPPMDDLVVKFATMSIRDKLCVNPHPSENDTPPGLVQREAEAFSPPEITTIVPPTPTSGHPSEPSTPTTADGLSAPFHLLLPSLSSPYLRPIAPYSTPSSRTSLSPSPSPTSTLVSPSYAVSQYKLVLPGVPQIPDWLKRQDKAQLQVLGCEEDVGVNPMPVNLEGGVGVALAMPTSPLPDASQPVLVSLSAPAPTPSCNIQLSALVSPSTPTFGQQDVTADQLPKTKPTATRRKPRRPKFRIVMHIECWRRDVDIAIYEPTPKRLQPFVPSAKVNKRTVKTTPPFRGYSDQLPVYYSIPGSWRWELPEWEYEWVMTESI
ncbi:hypothetical protein CPB83DRAFT_846996 [Crepidotus variabilis]|uniref:Uncharacterized protein n=1 Tax=Crepidotus variabilis TaxID=179855 RepID=A0A9P6EPK0_9AGAR|nr:hypothetical protein CPB83DRAFT_846996 [Crepidotus variabilis]